MNLKYCVEQLISYLSIYENLIQEGFFEEKDREKVEEFVLRIFFLKELIQNDESRLFEYNYEQLRENFSFLFWGKDFSEIFEESKTIFVKTIATFNTIFECIETLQRECGGSLPYFDPTEEDIWGIQNNGDNVEYIEFYDKDEPISKTLALSLPQVGENYGEWLSRHYEQQHNLSTETAPDEKIYVLKIDSFNKNGIN